MSRPQLYKVFVFGLLVSTVLLLSACTFDPSSLFNQNKDKVVKGEVLGLQKVPTYPNTDFLFAGIEEEPEVKKLLAEGKSAYHINTPVEFDLVAQFYKAELKDRGWKFEKQVPLESKVEKYGYYWTKGDKGLRIYQQINDIWYESITAQDAKEGLASLVAKEKREYYNPENLTQLSSVAKGYWDFKFPDSWYVEQKNSAFSNGLDLKFKYDLGGFEITIMDLSDNLGTSHFAVSQEYLRRINDKKEEKDQYSLYVDSSSTVPVEDAEDTQEEPEAPGETTSTPIPAITNPYDVKVGDLNALEMVIVHNSSQSKGYVTFVQHPKTGGFFAIVNVIGDKEFYDYIKSNLKAT